MAKTKDRLRTRNPKRFKQCRTKDIGEKEGVKAVICFNKERKPGQRGSSKIQSLFWDKGNKKQEKEAKQIAKELGCKRIIKKEGDFKCSPLLR